MLNKYHHYIVIHNFGFIGINFFINKLRPIFDFFNYIISRHAIIMFIYIFIYFDFNYFFIKWSVNTNIGITINPLVYNAFMILNT